MYLPNFVQCAHEYLAVFDKVIYLIPYEREVIGGNDTLSNFDLLIAGDG